MHHPIAREQPKSSAQSALHSVAQRRARELIWSLLIAFLTIIAVWQVGADLPFGYLGYDTEEYHAFADSIRSGQVLQPLDPAASHRGLFIRPPGYPVIVLFADWAGRGDMRSGLALIHGVMYLSAAWLWCLAWRGVLHPAVAAGLLGPSAFRMSEAFRSDMAEWTALCGIIATAALVVSLLRSPRQAQAVALGGSTALLILVKPVFLFLIPYFFVSMLKRGRTALLLFAAGLLPLALWMGLNTYRVGSFTIAQQDGFAFFYIASLLGPAPISGADEGPLKECLSLLNDSRLEFSDQELSASRFVAPTTPKNNQPLIYELSASGKFTWPELHNCMRVYAWRSIEANFSRYLTHVGFGLLTLRESLVELFLLAFLAVRLRKTAFFGAWMSLTMFLIALHCGNVVTVIASQVMLPRYYILTAQGLGLAVITGIALWMNDIANRRLNSPRSHFF